MDAKTGFFYLFSVVLLFAAFRVVTARNPVHAVLNLILAFSQAAAIWLLLKAEFLGIALVLVYLGAVMVLSLIGVLIAFEMGMVLMGGFGDVEDAKAVGATMVNAAGQTVPYSNTQALGKLLYTEYLYPVEIAAVILLVAMIAAIALTLRKRKDSKAMNPADQIRVRASDRIKLVKVDSTKPAQKPDAEAAAAAPAVETKA